ncbi:SMI1/KNR4 family protein [Sphingosinicella rhizophila]|uniref:SMI1/KNR4 family protein n=1 Tax=Sphingosinicella rhizophila TaxID=3050082 RepID=A0ABU3Q9Z7_9SPHN|nr:SMI1/KNR4 family protein [Sphingosinicella sp. GR2756]MDT9600230.1 SMI1/KNR4 family protein [Sphingosinicella sp. GR2756]
MVDPDDPLHEFKSHPPADPDDMSAAEIGFHKPLPDDYKAFLSEHDGGEGFIGEHYVVLWRASDLLRFNSEYQVGEYAPGLIAFGSNGGGEGFAFDTRCHPYAVVIVPFIGMSLADSIPAATSFTSLIERMKKDPESLLG